MGRMTWVGLGGLAMLPVAAQADTGEASVRALGEVRWLAETIDGHGKDVPLAGAGAQLGYGLTPTLSVTLRYGFETSGELRLPGGPPGLSEVLHLRRHALLAGASYAPSDELTPVFLAEVGALSRQEQERQWRLQTDAGERQVAPFLSDRAEWRAAARLSAVLEWRFLDAVSVAGGVGGEWAGAWSAAALLWVGGYRYL